MSMYVRGNELVAAFTFTDNSGLGAVPTNAEVVLTYTNLGGSQSLAVVTLTEGGDGVTWSGNWDSSVAMGCNVEWHAHCWGGLIAAMDGCFDLSANDANLST